MKYIYKTILIFVIIFLIPYNILAQQAFNGLQLLSPSTTSMAKFGDLPVSYHTGTVNLSIPIHTFSSKGIDLPISIDYDASGVRLANLPTTVGQNWTLNSGGVITRIVHGYPDDYKYAKRDADSFHVNPFINYFENPFSAQQDGIDLINDKEPDTFIFNFMGKTGKFYLTPQKEWKVDSDWNIDVIFDIKKDTNFDYPFIKRIPFGLGETYTKGIRGFILKDENGNQYTFGYDRNAIECSIPFNHQIRGDAGDNQNNPTHSIWTADSWYLTEVKDKFSNIIYQFKYERGYFIANLEYAFTEVKKKFDNSKWYQLFSLGVIGYSHSYNTSYDGKLILPCYLTRIIDSRNKIDVDFSYQDNDEPYYESLNLASPSGDRHYPFYLFLRTKADAPSRIDIPVLDSVCNHVYGAEKQVLDNYGSAYYKILDNNNLMRGLKMRKLSFIQITGGGFFMKRYHFTYNYGDSNRRLFLTAIAYDPYPHNKETYKFIYNKKDLLLDYLSTSKDNWGYMSNSQNKEVDTEAIKYGSLNTIIYPTGGRSYIEYEPNSYTSVRSLDKQSMISKTGIAGGLRVASITEFSSDDVILAKRKFHYAQSKGGASSGQLSAEPKRDWGWETTGIDGKTKIYTEIKSLTSIIPLANHSGPIVGYSSVIEESLDGSYTQYDFSNFSDFKDEPPLMWIDGKDTREIGKGYSFPVNPNTKYTDKGFMRGKLLSIKYFNNTNQLLKTVRYTYRDDYPSNKSISASNILSIGSFGEYGGSASVSGNVYKIYYSPYDVVQEDIITYPNGEINQPIVETKKLGKSDLTYKLNSFGINRSVEVRKLTSETINTSEGNNITKRYYYPQITSKENYLSDLALSFRIKEPYMTTIHKGSRSIGASVIQYHKFGNIIAPQKYLKSFTDSLPINLVQEVLFGSYDDIGNIKSYQLRGKPSEVAIWGGGNKNTLLAIVENSNNSDSILNLLNKDLIYNDYLFDKKEELINEFNKLRKILPNCIITSYTYNSSMNRSNNIPYSITQPSSLTEYYDFAMADTRRGSIKDNDSKVIQTVDLKVKTPEYKIISYPDSISSLGEHLYNSLNAHTFYAIYTNPEVSVSYTHFNYSYSWYLKNEKGEIISQKENSPDNFFTSPSNINGTYTVSCILKTEGLNQQETANVSKRIKAVYFPFRTKFNVSNSCLLHIPFNASVEIENGSQKFSYLWTLKSEETNEILSTQTTPNFSYTVTRSEIYKVKLICNISDNIAGTKTTKEFVLNVHDRKGRIELQEFDGCCYGYGRIILPYRSHGDYLLVRAFIRADGSKSVKIGSYSVNEYSGKTIEIPIKNNEMNFEFHINDNRGPGYIEFIGLKNTSNDINLLIRLEGTSGLNQ